MIDRPAIEQILAQYKKHGWRLRRVLMSNELASRLGDPAAVFEDAQVLDSNLDAAWFSRSSRPGMTAWELRYLGPMPYALVEGLSEDLDPEEAEARLLDVEERMRAAVRARPTSH